VRNRPKVEKLHRIQIAFYDGPLLDATQYYQNLMLCQGSFFFIFYSLMAKRVFFILAIMI